MYRNPGRRSALLLLASAGIPTALRAQGSLLPPETTPAAPPPTLPATPAPTTTVTASPPHPASLPASAIDKTKSYYVFFDQNIDVNSMRALRRQLANLAEAGVSEITLVLDSAGGQIEPMLITYSFILALPTKINTHAQGFVQSAATLLFLAGQDRSADRYARFAFHPSQAPISGLMGEEQIRERAAAFATIGDVMAQICRDRTSLTDAEIARFGKELVYYTAEEARNSGVVQTVADLRIPGEGKSKILFMD
jgi:ATP-dependent protease ClpP protease subunit